MGARHGILAASAVALAVAASSAAWGHGADPAVAYLNGPTGVGNVIDDSFMLMWVDADRSIPTGTATVDFFYTNRQAPTFLNGERHEDLVGEPIVQGIWEKEMPNEYVWDTSNVPAGSYLLWSQVVEPPEENMAVAIIEFSPGILTIAHPGDPIHPAVLLTQPSSPFKFADDEFIWEYEAFDPDGTGRVRLEAGRDPNGEGFMLVAEDLPATATASFAWDTSQIAEGDYILRATIEDDRGLSFHHYARYFLLVTHPPNPRLDAGIADAGGPRDGGSRPASDAGVAEQLREPEGCGCVTSGSQRSGGLLVFGLLAVGLLLRRRGLQLFTKTPP